MSQDLLCSSIWGVLRGVSVHTLIYPLEVVKIRQQCSQGELKSVQVAMELLRQEGVGGFYSGLLPQLLKTSIKQIWCWPMITGMPSFFKNYQIGNLQQQALTGLSIAIVDAVISTPLERAKIVMAFSNGKKFSIKGAYKDGWRGFTAHLSKLSVNWSVFLTAQKYLRDQSGALSKGSLSFSQLIKIGAEVGIIVSLASAPFDLANTLKQAKNVSPFHLLRRKEILKLYRGWPLSAISLVIHNIASVTLIDKLGKP